jgi:phosphatidylethanolamine/phosphatidyl-N-methylethanolamine N-methyltransferase
VQNAQIIQQTYDWCSGFYDFFFQPWLEFGRRRSVEALDLCHGDLVLEIGTGTGLGMDLFPPDVRVVAFDYSPGMLRQAKSRIDREARCPFDLLQMDVQKMAFPDQSFDRIIAAYVLTVVPDLHAALAEILRVAKPGATIVLVNHLRSANPALSWIEDTFHPLFSQLGLFSLDRDLLGTIRSFGIDEIVIEPTSFLGLHYIITFRAP